MPGLENEDPNKEKHGEKDADVTGPLLMRWVAPRGSGFECIQADVRALRISEAEAAP